MIRVSKRFADRAKTNLRRFQKILEGAKARDVNESDTSVIVSDFLGYPSLGVESVITRGL